MRTGIPVILSDDDQRENEGDLVIAAEKITEATLALMIRECSGIVCLCLDDSLLDPLHLPPMVEHNESHFGTAFTVSIGARFNVTTGVSAKDRLTTIQAAIAEGAKATDLVSPGHIFPLRAKQNGVLERAGHTEGSVDLAILAGLKPAAVICELMNPDGSMMQGQDLQHFADQHHFPMLSIAELIRYRSESNTSSLF